jgi:hypothetical protein
MRATRSHAPLMETQSALLAQAVVGHQTWYTSTLSLIVELNRRPSVAAIFELNSVFRQIQNYQRLIKMKSLTAFVILIPLAFSVVTVPATARLDATETLALAKSDRLEIHRDIRDCSKQVWPSFDRSCLGKGTALKWRVIPLIRVGSQLGFVPGRKQSPDQGDKSKYKIKRLASAGPFYRQNRLWADLRSAVFQAHT